MCRPRLIITADDYGMSPQFNRGMLEAAKVKLITGISVMIKRKYVRKADILRADVCLGLHLELASSSSYQEVLSQIHRFKKRFGQLPDYLDGHQHRHVLAENLPFIIRAAKRCGLPVRSRLPEDRLTLGRHGITTPDNFISWHPERIPVLEKRLRGAQSFPLTELVVHPGYPDERCSYPYNQEREAELGFLQSQDFRKLLKTFRLVGYNGFVDSPAHVRMTDAGKTRKGTAPRPATCGDSDIIRNSSRN